MHLATGSHASIFPNPVKIKVGEQFQLSGKADNWDGYIWLWAKTTNGQEGWVPNDLPVDKNQKTLAAYNYSAFELDVEAGEKICVLKESHGWAWYANSGGLEGWVPLKILTPC